MDKRALAAAIGLCIATEFVPAKADIVPVSSTIQAAVDAAEPGDIILVPPGTYHESVRVLKNDITILGPRTAIIDASGFANGIHVGADIFTPSPNPVCPNTSTDEDIARIPAGTGILNVATDRLTIRENKVTGNNTLGVAITANPLASLDPRIDPNPDGNRVLLNTAVDNGAQPGPGLPGADLFYDGNGQGNCFSTNRFGTSVPPGIASVFPCTQ